MKSPLLNLIIWVAVCSGALIAHGMWYTTIAHKSAVVVELQKQIDSKTETADHIASARTTLAEIAGDETIIQGYFVPETGVVPFIDALEKRARAHSAGMKVLSVSVSGSSKQPTLVLALTIDGTFDAVMRTIGAIEYAPYYLSVTKFSLGKNEKEVWHATLEIVVGSVPATPATNMQVTAPDTISLLTTHAYF